MAHPLLWPGKVFFYPIGNTSPICLTQDLALEETANILLLGCGDPRHILFTVHASAADVPQSSRPLDITCCDVESAVLARNVLLLTLLADEDASDNITKIWNLFYHLYIDKASLSLLIKQCQKLVNISETLQDWQASKYGHFLKMCTAKTLLQLRHFWTLYLQTESLPPQKHKRFQEDFATNIRRNASSSQYTFSSVRSAGPFSVPAIMVLPKIFNHYWKTGTTSYDSNEISEAKLANPTFAYSSSSSDKFVVHYGTDPIAPFHPAEAFLPRPATSGSPSEEDVVTTAKAQFRRWAVAFSCLLRKSSPEYPVTIRVFAGDALAFCTALRYCSMTKDTSTPLYTSPWDMTSIILNETNYGPNAAFSAPTAFNVIETSNLLDHIGLLNVLIATSPILSRVPTSTIYTEALLSYGVDPMSSLLDRACCDLPTLSFLLGLIPSTFISQFTTHSNVHEIVSHRGSPSFASQFHERVAWKIPAGADPAVCRPGVDVNQRTGFDASQLAKLLFSIYLKMFGNEDLKNIMGGPPERSPGATLTHYNRRTFAELLRVAKERIHVDWQQTMSKFSELVVADKNLIIGSNNYQDMCCQLHLLGVDTVDTLSIEYSLSRQRIGSPETFRGWKTIPPTICIVLVVPQAAIASVRSLLDQTGTPSLHVEIHSPSARFSNMFTSIQAAYGTFHTTGTRENKRIVVRCDSTGRFGELPLVISFWMPSWILTLAPRDTHVAMGVQSTPGTAKLLLGKLGMNLRIFSSPLMDERNVHILTERPNLEAGVEKAAALAAWPAELGPCSTTIRMDDPCRQIEMVTVRMDVTDTSAQSSLAGGATVTTTQLSPYVVQVSIGNTKQSTYFPLPVDALKSKLRVARKSMYVEVVVPVALGPAYRGVKALLGRFPIVSHGQNLTSWNVHRVDLDRLPALQTTTPGSMEWLRPLCFLMFSDREKRAREGVSSGTGVSPDTLMNLKDSLLSIFGASSGLSEPNARVFALAQDGPIGAYTLIFVNELRLDLASHTAVADAWVLPMTLEILPHVLDAISGITASIMHIKTDAEEMRAWKQFLPAITERCRTWKHKTTCEYEAHGAIPLSMEWAESPICSCGRGVGSQALSKVEKWSAFMPYVTRAALSPLFAVSYLEEVGTWLTDGEAVLGTPLATSPAPSCAACQKKQLNLRLCGKCKKVRYCSPECQKKDWKAHKAHCTQS
ncbi:hypothetical protein BV22DRAFT_1194548 [Leucogyrophana mollusca]|uniref:Uncharacterized protein n=1 Tax=Leucogyrophana mollusca TaxID=85980 RepID=A0ACB8BM08_9AGAM|nr:hypothetical protein BV22DRAFT_1194548 [Leucogyrophana mollusca]